MNRKIVSTLFLAILLIWVAGCSEYPTDSDDNSTAESFGGYKAVAEEPGFGDPDLLAEAGDNEEYDDPVLHSPEVDSVVCDPEVGHYHLRAVWGQLRCDTTITAITDWTGSLTISRGIEVIRRVIHFEPAQDTILARTEPGLIEWVSATTVHNDGIAVDLFIPPDTEETDPITVAFETGPYSQVFTLDELVSLDTIVYLDDADSNAVAFHGFRFDHAPCPRGFLTGSWGYDDDGEGVFRGMWMSRPGVITGYLDGWFGEDEEGQNVFFGKWISLDGEFEGFVRGTYGFRPNANSNGRTHRWNTRGWFTGGIYDSDEVKIGVLGGKYRSHPRFRDGFFQGRWKLECNFIEGEGDGINDGL